MLEWFVLFLCQGVCCAGLGWFGEAMWRAASRNRSEEEGRACGGGQGDCIAEI